MPTELVGEAEDGENDGVGTPRAHAGPRATADHQAPQSQHARALGPAVSDPGGACRTDSRKKFPASDPDLVLSYFWNVLFNPP